MKPNLSLSTTSNLQKKQTKTKPKQQHYSSSELGVMAGKRQVSANENPLTVILTLPRAWVKFRGNQRQQGPCSGPRWAPCMLLIAPGWDTERMQWPEKHEPRTSGCIIFTHTQPLNVFLSDLRRKGSPPMFFPGLLSLSPFLSLFFSFLFILLYFFLTKNLSRTLLVRLFSWFLPFSPSSCWESRGSTLRCKHHKHKNAGVCQIVSLCKSEFFSWFHWSGVDLH